MYKTIKVLEFDEILARAADFAISEPTKARIARIRPENDFSAACLKLSETNEAYLVKHKYVLNPLTGFDDVSGITAKAEVGARLTMGELLKVSRLLRSGRIAQKTVSQTGEDIVLIKNIANSFFMSDALEKTIDGSIESENEMSDNASDKLKSVRRRILAAGVRLRDKLSGYFRSGELSMYLQDNLVTVRSGRYVLPVKSECRQKVPGLIHDQSATGSTVFIEPFAVVEMNNEIKTLKSEEETEIERILTELSADVAASRTAIDLMQNALTELEEIFARCDYGISIGGVLPRLNNNGRVKLTAARHPLIDPAKVVPVDIQIGEKYRILTITGPNTGGKTVTLKTVGLLCLMACCGIFIPAEEGSELAVFDDIFCDIGDEQSISLSLSTFSGHMNNVAYIADTITPSSLVLLDEIGAGTDPEEGAALAVGILKYVELIGCVALVTTHYGALKEYALTSGNIVNGCMQFDEATLKPTYKLMMGIPGTSNALTIAASLGLNDYIMAQARQSLDSGKVSFERVLSEAERVKSEALSEKERLSEERQSVEELKKRLTESEEKLKSRLEKINENARLEVKRIVGDAVDTADELIEEIKAALKKGNEEALIEAHRARRKLEELKYSSEKDTENIAFEPLLPGDIEVGARVYVRFLGAEGVITEFSGKRGEACVRMGAMAVKVPVAEIGRAVAPRSKKTFKTEAKPAVPVEYAAAEVKVLGNTVVEALEIIEPLLIGMSEGEGAKTLKIIHGKGTGALGRGIHEYLRLSPYVTSYRYGQYGEGERGVTFAEVK